MFRKMTQMAANRFAEYRTQAEDCRHIAEDFSKDSIGREFAELARRWRALVEQSGSSARLAA